ncbi:hypothetical protein FVER53590_13106 [Fusarium verticillioides]|nr:hypothetical protein FVER53263_13106 [Fusarium verticillioides]RBR14423.1 hypothetical protein FVER53590_13106 [Fusarium verticillioides]
MNGTQSPDAQKAANANTNGSNSNNSSLAAKKRKKDLKPIITMEGTNQPAGRITLHNLDFGEPLRRTLLWHSPRGRWFYGSHAAIPKSPRRRWSDVANDPDTTQLL